MLHVYKREFVWLCFWKLTSLENKTNKTKNKQKKPQTQKKASKKTPKMWLMGFFKTLIFKNVPNQYQSVLPERYELTTKACWFTPASS